MLVAGIGSVIAEVSDQAQTIMQFSAALIAVPITYFILGKL